MQVLKMNVLEQILVENLKLSNDMHERFLELSDTKHLKKKGFFTRVGKVCHHIGFIETGVLRSYFENGNEVFIKDFYFSGMFVVALGSFLTGEPCIGSVQAIEDCHLITLSRTAFEQLLKESNEWLKLKNYISDSLLARKCSRETSFLINDAYERYKLLLKTYPKIEQHVSQYDIASYLGIRPESLSRMKAHNIGQ
jgi:CRP-like cAMP-binding protein